MNSELLTSQYGLPLGNHLAEVLIFLNQYEELETEVIILLNIARSKGKLEEALTFLLQCKSVAHEELRDQLIDKQYQFLKRKRPQFRGRR